MQVHLNKLMKHLKTATGKDLDDCRCVGVEGRRIVDGRIETDAELRARLLELSR
jgi:hypothetical protein